MPEPREQDDAEPTLPVADFTTAVFAVMIGICYPPNGTTREAAIQGLLAYTGEIYV